MNSTFSPDRLKELGTATIHEAQGRKGAFHSALKPIAPEMRLAGPAITIDCPPGDNLLLHYALTIARPGEIIVVDAKGFTEAGVWGDVLTLAAQTRGVGGLVVDGCVRDGNSIVEMGFPVFSRGLSIKGTSKVQKGRVNVPIHCGGVLVSPGDIVVGDRDGLVVIERAAVENVMRAAEAREAHEDQFRQAIRDGKSTVDLLKLAPVLEKMGFPPRTTSEVAARASI